MSYSKDPVADPILIASMPVTPRDQSAARAMGDKVPKRKSKNYPIGYFGGDQIAQELGGDHLARFPCSSTKANPAMIR